MATVNKLKAQIENANAIGIANLKEKGVEFMSSNGCAPTTYEIVQAISLIDTGSGSDGEGKPQLTADSCVSSVLLPVIVPTVTAEINSNIIVDSSAGLEE